MTKKKAFITIITAMSVLVLAAALSACSGNSAESKVKDELAQLKTSETAAASLDAVKENLPDEADKDFETFLGKVRKLNYDIIGSETGTDDSGGYTIVDVKIRTYDFGREYVATWTDYLKNHKNAPAEDAEGQEFYRELFSRLAKIKNKDRISFVEIKVRDSEDGLTTDIQTNEALQDALFGGMISEMKSLAGE